VETPLGHEVQNPDLGGWGEGFGGQGNRLSGAGDTLPTGERMSRPGVGVMVQGFGNRVTTNPDSRVRGQGFGNWVGVQGLKTGVWSRGSRRVGLLIPRLNTGGCGLLEDWAEEEGGSDKAAAWVGMHASVGWNALCLDIAVCSDAAALKQLRIARRPRHTLHQPQRHSWRGFP